MRTEPTQPDGQRSELFALADSYVSSHLALSPMMATRLGAGEDDRLDDFSPDHFAAWEDLVRSTLAALGRLQPADEVDRVGRSLMVERLTRRLATLETGEVSRTFSVLWSPVSDIRRIFEMQPASNPAEAEAARRRLSLVPSALESWRKTLQHDGSAGRLASRRQAAGVATQLETYAKGSFAELAARFAERSGTAHGHQLLSAGRTADAACAALAS